MNRLLLRSNQTSAHRIERPSPSSSNDDAGGSQAGLIQQTNDIDFAEQFRRRTFFRQRPSRDLQHQWKRAWSDYQRSHSRRPCVAANGDLSAKRLDLHKNLSEAESSLAVQMGTDRIELAEYFHLRRVSTVSSPGCPCGWTRQTLKHVLLSCSQHMTDRSIMCSDAGTTDYRTLLSTEKGLRAANR